MEKHDEEMKFKYFKDYMEKKNNDKRKSQSDYD